MKTRLIALGGAFGLALLSLAALLGSLQMAGRAAAQTAPATGEGADPRWLALIFSREEKQLEPLNVTPPTLNYHATDRFIAGRTAFPDPVAITITHEARTVATLLVTPIPDESGFFYLADVSFHRGYSDEILPRPGSVLWVAQNGAAISLTVPTFTALAYPETEAVAGQAPAGAALIAYLYPFDAPGVVITRSATATGPGLYQMSWSPADVRPRDSGYVRYVVDQSRNVYVRFVAPFLRAQVGGHQVSGLAAPHSWVRVTVASPSGQPAQTFELQATRLGEFRGQVAYCRDEFCDRLQSGQTLTATSEGQVFALTLPPLTAQVDRAAGQLYGQAPAGARIEIAHRAGPLPDFFQPHDFDTWFSVPEPTLAVSATAGGSYSITLPLRAADYGAAFVTTAEGHQAYARYAVPYFLVRLPDVSPFYLVRGQLNEPAMPLTLTIQGPSGFLKAIRQATTNSSGYFSDPSPHSYWPVNLTVEAGDVLTVTTAQGAVAVLPVPLVTAQADVNSQQISGQAPPNALVTLWLDSTDVFPSGPPAPEGYVFTATASAAGTFTLDLSAFGRFGFGASGEVRYTSPEGYDFIRTFRTRQYCLPRLERVYVGGDFLMGAWFGDKLRCTAFAIRLRSASGGLKFERTGLTWDNFYLTLEQDGQRVRILPGDRLELESGGQSQVFTVPPLSISVDLAGQRIYGRSTPGVPLRLTVGAYLPDDARWTLKYYSSVTVTTNALGDYTLSYPLKPGWGAAVEYPGYPTFVANNASPALRAYLYQPFVEGVIDPFTPYTLTRTSRPLGITETVAGISAPGGFLFAGKLGELNWVLFPGAELRLDWPNGVRQFTVPRLTAKLDRTTRTVSGLAPPNARLAIELAGHIQVITSTALGEYAATFPPQRWPSSDSGWVLYADARGDQTLLEYAAPRWEVTLDTPCATGHATTPNAPFTATLRAGDGTLKGEVGVVSDFWPKFQACFAAPISTGDQLVMTGPDATPAVTFTVPFLTAAHDFGRRVVTGQAPPGALAVYLPVHNEYGFPLPPRWITVAPGGRYGADVSDLDLPLHTVGQVEVRDEFGHLTRRMFVVVGYQTYLPLVAR
ncbi:MAG: hypothetical protein RMK99_14650 [Anaerolineales bacterium]|nr:hypothetical protein [Anaerolineales bacterium]